MNANINDNKTGRIISEEDSAALYNRLDKVLKRMWDCLDKNNLSKDDVKLVAISKWHSPESVYTVAKHWWELGGHPIFGENYMQEALAKQGVVNNLLKETTGAKSPEWHFTGHVQSRKSKDVLGNFSLLHTLDSVSLASNLLKSIKNLEKDGQSAQPQDVLIQVNIGEEPQKSGVMPDDLPNLVRDLQGISSVEIKGLMCLPPHFGDAEVSRPYFKKLRQMRDVIEQKFSISLPHLSMGMSADFEAAIEEGASLIRVGTDIFGPRQY